MRNPRDSFRELASEYCRRYGLRLADDTSLGFGVHGRVFTCIGEIGVRTALKIHEYEEAYCRERDVYLRLLEHEVEKLGGHHVPQMLNCDDQLLAIEMTIVSRPFLLDFGGAYLDRKPDYEEATMTEWLAEKEEQFGSNWDFASEILAKLRSYGIYVADVNPGNIGFVADEKTE